MIINTVTLACVMLVFPLTRATALNGSIQARDDARWSWTHLLVGAKRKARPPDYTWVRCVDTQVYDLIQQWREQGALQDHNIGYIVVAEGFRHILRIQNKEAVLLNGQEVKRLVRLIPFYHAVLGFCWAAFEIVEIGVGGAKPLALVDREQWEVFALHAARLDLVVSPRVLRIAPFLETGARERSEPKCSRLDYPSALRVSPAEVASQNTRRAKCSAPGCSATQRCHQKRVEISNRKLMSGIRLFGSALLRGMPNHFAAKISTSSAGKCWRSNNSMWFAAKKLSPLMARRRRGKDLKAIGRGGHTVPLASSPNPATTRFSK